MLTGSWPNAKVVHVRGKAYKDLCDKFQMASARPARAKVKEQWDNFSDSCMPFATGHLKDMAGNAGFEESWLGSVNRRRAASPVQQCARLRVTGTQAFWGGTMPMFADPSGP